MKRVRLIALTIALCCNIPFVAAEDNRWYQVDLVVFRYTNNTSGELWPAVAERLMSDGVIRLYTSEGDDNGEEEGNNNVAYVSLPAQQMLLNDQVSALRKKRDYQVLTQRAWRMPVGKKGYPVAIEASIEGSEPVSLDGTVMVTLERFLHVEVDLWLNKLTPATIFSEQDSTFVEDDFEESELLEKSLADSPSMLIAENFQLKQRRRIRNSKEVHYLDSPEIGVLIKLTPV